VDQKQCNYVWLYLRIALILGPRAGLRKGSDGDVTDAIDKVQNNSQSSTSSDTIVEVEEVEVKSQSTPREIVSRILKSPVASEEETVNSIDNRYFYFFLSHMASILPYTSLFPFIISDVFARCVPHITLRHSVLSISSMIVDYRLQRSMDRFHFLYIMSLQKIQNAIERMSLDEGTTIAVFLILWIDVVRAELRSSRKHLRGLYLLLQELQKNYRPPESAPGMLVDQRGGLGVSPLIMQIWRIAIRLDFTTSLYLVEAPIFPPIPPEQQDLHRRWISLSTMDEETADWALAAFAQDNLIHRACHVASQARLLRKSPTYTPEVEAQIRIATAKLAKQCRDWFERRIVRIAEAEEQAAQLKSSVSSESTSPSDTPSTATDERLSSFLDYPQRQIVNPFYANLVVSARASSIYISLIAHPTIGPDPDPQRFKDAVDICQILAALGEDRPNTASSKIWVVFLTGAALGGLTRNPRETQWLLWRMQGIVRMFPLMKDAVATYEKLWEAKGDFWDEMDKAQAKLYK
jgi:hypothetical protein